MVLNKKTDISYRLILTKDSYSIDNEIFTFAKISNESLLLNKYELIGAYS